MIWRIVPIGRTLPACKGTMTVARKSELSHFSVAPVLTNHQESVAGKHFFDLFCSQPWLPFAHWTAMFSGPHRAAISEEWVADRGRWPP